MKIKNVEASVHQFPIYLPIANGGGWPIFNMHTMAGLMNGTWTEFHWGMWQAGKRFFKGSPSPENGRVTIPDRAGLGFEPDDDMLRESLVEDPADLLEAGMQTNFDVIAKARSSIMTPFL